MTSIIWASPLFRAGVSVSIYVITLVVSTEEYRIPTQEWQTQGGVWRLTKGRVVRYFRGLQVGLGVREEDSSIEDEEGPRKKRKG